MQLYNVIIYCSHLYIFVIIHWPILLRFSSPLFMSQTVRQANVQFAFRLQMKGRQYFILCYINRTYLDRGWAGTVTLLQKLKSLMLFIKLN